MVVCPSCKSAELILDGEWCVCGHCGHRAARVFVVELDWLRQQRRLVDERIAWLSDRVAAGDRPEVIAEAREGELSQPLTGQQMLLFTGGLLLVTAAAVFVAVNWQGLGVAAQVASVVLAIAVAGTASHMLRPRSPATASTLAAVACGVLGVGLAAGPQLLVNDPYTGTFDRSAWYAIAGLITAGAAGVTWRLTGDRGYGIAGLVAVGLASMFEAVWMYEHLTDTGALVAATVQAAVLTAVAVRLWWPAAVAAAGPAVLAAGLLLVAYVSNSKPFTTALLLFGAAGLWLAVDWTRPAPLLRRLVVPAALLSAGLGALPGDLTGVVALVVLAACGLAAALVRHDRALALAASIPVATGSLIVYLAMSPPPESAAVVWAAAAVGLLGVGVLPGLRLAGPASTVFGWAAEASLVEAYGWEIGPELFGVLAAAPAFLAATVWAVATRSVLPSLPLWGPGLGLLVLPSALASGAGEHAAVRTVGVLAASALLAGVGVRFRLAAPIVVATVAAGIVALQQAGTLIDLMPRWLSLLLAGGALLVSGLRIERLRKLGTAGRVAFTALR